MMRLAVLRLVVGKLANALCVVQREVMHLLLWKNPSVKGPSESEIPTVDTTPFTLAVSSVISSDAW